MEPVYTPEFFTSLERMIDKRPHKCRGCGIRDGTKRWNKDGSRQKFSVVVRLCVIDKSLPVNLMTGGFPNEAKNIGMFCTRCRKPDQVWKTPRRMKPSALPQLFVKPMTKLEEIQAQARNKVPPKVQVDEDGNIIPF